MVLKRLKLHQFLIVWHKLFPMHKHGCRKGAGIFQQKRLFSWFRVIKNFIVTVTTNFTTFAPLQKLLEKSTTAPLEKILLMPMHMSM